MPSKLVKMIRTKYPGEYDDIPDEELERLVTTKYPGEYDDLLVPDEEPIAAKQEPGLISKVLDSPAFQPLTESFGDIAGYNKTYFNEAAGQVPEFLAPVYRGLGSANESIGNFIDSLTSPVDLGALLLSGGSSAAAKKGLTTLARGLGTAGRIASAGPAAHGAREVVAPDRSLLERGLGAMEAVGGLAGMFGPAARPRLNSAITDPLAGTIEPTSVMAPRFKIDPIEPYRTGTSQPITPESILTDSAGNPLPSRMKFPGRTRFKLEKDGTYTNPDTGENITEAQMLWKELEEVSAQNSGLSAPESQIRNSAGKPISRISPYETKTTPFIVREGKIINTETGLEMKPEEFVINSDRTVSPPNMREVKIDIDGKQVAGPALKTEEVNKLREVLAFPRAVMASIDLPPMRQGLPLITTRAWWTAWKDMAKSYGSKGAFDAAERVIKSDPLYETSERAGISFTDLLSQTEESYASRAAKSVPLVARSHRAHTAYLNKLRFDTFKRMYNQAIAANKGTELDPSTNDVVLSQIGNFINDATGRGSLDFSKLGSKKLNLEKQAALLNDVFFSPRLMASRVRMWNRYFNPQMYRMMTPEIRKETLRSLLGTVGTWTSIAGLAKAAGADVSMDPTNTDFGKIKIGDFRMDPAGGFQQYLVAGTRFASGMSTSSTSGKTTETGQGFGSRTRGDIAQDFFSNKLNPPVKFIHDLMFASTGRPINVGDQALSLVMPIMVQDLIQILQEDPKLLGLLPLAMSGMGVQSYAERGEGKIIPKKKDYQFTGGSPFR